MDPKTVQDLLNRNGFPCGPVDGVIGARTKDAVRRFQAAHAFTYLALDGLAGPQTFHALSALPNLSPNFTVAEVACHGAECGHLCYVRRELLTGLETTRARIGKPVAILDAYRCPQHNRAVGGKSNSQHPLGLAADLRTYIGVSNMAAYRIWSGIGYRNGKTTHVDARHVDPSTNTTKSTPEHPALFLD